MPIPTNTIPTGASFHRGKSKQDYRTPDDFRDAVLRKFSRIDFDLAASRENVFAFNSEYHYDEEDNSLQQSWGADLSGQLWLNPPFGNVTPWAKKCWEEARTGAKILFLVPASVGSNWFQNYVDSCAMIYFLNPRLCFDGKNPFPKDMLLASYNDLNYLGQVGYRCWKWK